MDQREEKKSIKIEQNINDDQTKLSGSLDVKRGDQKACLHCLVLFVLFTKDLQNH